MKKMYALYVIGIVMILVICGCGKKETRDFHMENHAWTFANIVDSTTGTIIACGENEREKYPEAKVLDMVCEFRDNVMVIRDVNSGNGKEFSYTDLTRFLTERIMYKKQLDHVKAIAQGSVTHE